MEQNKNAFRQLRNLRQSVKAVDAGFMDKNPLNKFSVGDMSKENYDAVDHKHFVDTIVLTSKSGNKMYRESDLMTYGLTQALCPMLVSLPI